MSRCFPFPPPGYEKKTRTEDLDLLKKEKHKEKKYKKEKRDKEKKEGKEKRDKDRSDEKHREKKEKKEKHRDKKKNKEKSRDKDKNTHVNLDEKKFFGQAEAYKGEKNDEKSSGRGKEKSSVSGEKDLGYSSLYNGVVLGKNSHLTPESKNFKHLHQLGKKNAVEEGKRSSLSAENYASMEIRKDVGMPKMGVCTPATPMPSSERSKERRVIDGKMDRHGLGVEARHSGNVLVQKITGTAQNRLQGMARPVEKNAESSIEAKEKIRGKEGDGTKADKRKDKDREKIIQKPMEKDKEKKKERIREIGGQKLVEQSRTKDINRVHIDHLRGKDGNQSDLLIAQRARLEKLPNEGNKGAAVPENLRKRKEYGPYGVTYEDDVGPNKMARTTSSSLPMMENGRSLQLAQNSTVFSPDRQQALSNIKSDDKDRRKNGTINSCQSASRAPQAAAPVDQTSVAVKKLPHPDAKHLAQVLSVPKAEPWPEIDDQEWLFYGVHSQLKKPETEASGFDDTTPQVWAEAVRIDSADVFALPYVIPR